jgi:predicted nucleotidyltransferase
VLGDNLTSVVLFGSVARGEAGSRSDIDLFVVCRELPKGAFRRRRLVEPISDRLQASLRRLWERGVHAEFTEVLRSEEEAAHFHPLYLDMVCEAVLLYDRSGFFASVLARMRERLQAMGAKRRRLGRVTYWDLKPDFRPGEVIEL